MESACKPMQHVLIMEDNVMLALEWQKVFELNRYIVTVCHSGDEAILLLRDHDFDLIVTDLFVNGAKGGLHVIIAAKMRKKKLPPIIVVTGSSVRLRRKDKGNFFLSQASLLGASEAMEKPFPALDLVVKAQSLISEPA